MTIQLGWWTLKNDTRRERATVRVEFLWIKKTLKQTEGNADETNENEVSEQSQIQQT